MTPSVKMEARLRGKKHQVLFSSNNDLNREEQQDPSSRVLSITVILWQI